MSSNDEMYYLPRPCPCPRPLPPFWGFLFLSSLFVLLAYLKYYQLYLLYLYLFTDQILTVRSIQFRDDPLCRKGEEVYDI